MRRACAVAAWVVGVVCSVPLLAADVPTRQMGQMVLEGVPEQDAALRDRLRPYLNVRRASLASLADDGKSMLVTTRFGDTAQVHLVTAPLGMRRQLTFFDEPVGGGRFVPGSKQRRFLFGKDVGGNENTQIYTMDLDAGTWTMLTDGKSRNGGGSVSRDGRRLAFSSNLRNGRDMDIYLADLPDGRPRLAWEVEGAFGPGEFSPDGSRLLVNKYISEKQTQWFVFDVASGQAEEINPLTPPVYYGSAAWAADGRAIYFTSDREGEFRNLFKYDLAGKQWKNLTADIAWDVEDVAVEPTGRGIAFTVNDDGSVHLYFADADGGQRRVIDALPHGVIGGLEFARDGGVLGITINSPQIPGDVFTLTFPDAVITRWTESEIGGLDPSKFIEPELIRYPTFDQVDGRPRMIPAFYWKARQAGPRPVVIYAHGGPEGQTQPTFAATFQFMLAELGVSVIAPNIRGSTGYGRTFHQLDNGVLREDSVKDVGALLDWIAKQPELDASRVGIYGGSYGGYVVLASLANYPERFKAGVNVVGIANFITFLERTAEYRRDLRREEYGDERDPEVRAVLERISPLSNAERIQAALFVAHGQNDPRVPVGEAHQIVERLRELGRPVWFANALDEGHGFRKKENSDRFTALMMQFWQEHLLK